MWVLAALALPTAASLLALVDWHTRELRLGVDPSAERLLPEHDEERRVWARAQLVFGEDRSAIVALPTAGIFTPESLSRVQRISESLEDLPGVKRVLSLANAVDLPALGSVPDAEVVLELRDEVRQHPIYRDVLVSRDETVAAFVISFEDLDAAELVERNYAARIAEAAAPDVVWVTGAPILHAATARLLMRELATVLPGTLGVGALILLLAFGSVRGVVLPVATVLLALLWTLGTLAATGLPLNLVTISVPPLVMALGLAYAMHVLAERYREHAVRSATADGGEPECVERSLVAVSGPLLVAGLTTSAGLLALLLSPLAAVREFGLLAVMGVGYTLLLCFSLVPAGLVLFGRVRGLRPAPAGRLLEGVAGWLAAFDLRHRRAIVAAGVVALAVGVVGGFRVEVGASYVRDLPPDDPARLHHEAINAAFAGASPLSIVIETNLRDAFTDPELLREVEELQAWLEAQPEVGGTTSLVDHLGLLRRGVEGGPLELPDNQALAKQLLVLAGGEEIERHVDLLFHTTRIAVRTNVESTGALTALLERIERRLAQLPPLFQAQATGESVLLARTVERIAGGQLQSLGLALLAIYAILSALFTSLRVGLYALLPNVVPIGVFFGLLGFAGIDLGPSTSLVACIALGVAVDDTIHYMVRFQSEARSHASEEHATRRTLSAVVRPISFTTLLLCAGFLMLTTSELRNQVQFGALAAFTLAAAWVVDVTLTPALCAGVRIVTFWDVLRVDLGPDPQHSIPLMTGLTRREARTVALILDIREVAAGEPLVRQGDPITDVYVVIEGALAVWTERDGERVDLYQVSRGDVVGEVAYFATTSPAHVIATRDARLLRFEDSDLEYLVRRHPRIAAHIYRNLNRSQAGLLVQAARRIR